MAYSYSEDMAPRGADEAEVYNEDEIRRRYDEQNDEQCINALLSRQKTRGTPFRQALNWS